MTSSGTTKSRPARRAPGTRCGQQVHRGPRAGAERDARQLARAPDDRDHVGDDLLADARRIDDLAGLGDLADVGDDRDVLEPGRGDAALGQLEDPALVCLARIADVELEQEAVELRLRQRIGALVLDRVLRGDDEERVGQRAAVALDRDLPVLHRLEQRRLRLRRRAVDLVGQQEAREDRARAGSRARRRAASSSRSGPRAACPGVNWTRAKSTPERPGHGPRDQRLGDAGHALEQHVAAADEGDQHPVEHLVLADDHPLDGSYRLVLAVPSASPPSGSVPAAGRALSPPPSSRSSLAGSAAIAPASASGRPSPPAGGDQLVAARLGPEAAAPGDDRAGGPPQRLRRPARILVLASADRERVDVAGAAAAARAASPSTAGRAAATRDQTSASAAPGAAEGGAPATTTAGRRGPLASPRATRSMKTTSRSAGPAEPDRDPGVVALASRPLRSGRGSESRITVPSPGLARAAAIAAGGAPRIGSARARPGRTAPPPAARRRRRRRARGRRQRDEGSPCRARPRRRCPARSRRARRRRRRRRGSGGRRRRRSCAGSRRPSRRRAGIEQDGRACRSRGRRPLGAEPSIADRVPGLAEQQAPAEDPVGAAVEAAARRRRSLPEAPSGRRRRASAIASTPRATAPPACARSILIACRACGDDLAPDLALALGVAGARASRPPKAISS